MSRPQTYEQTLLNKAEQVLSHFSSDYEEKLLVLEACASMYGNFDIKDYWPAFGIITYKFEEVIKAGQDLYAEINATGIPPAMVISSLSREPISISEKKKQGAFYTDFRLAEFVADDCEIYIKKNCDLADIAAGTGILLVGVAERYYAKYPKNYDNWLSEHVYAFDLSSYALRGARAALAVHTSSVQTLIKMNENWEICDSLISDKLDDLTFDIVVGNPPWGKTKLSLHSFVNSNGANHVYGSEYEKFDETEFETHRINQIGYSKCLKEKYTLLGDSEPDMYMAFLQRAMASIKPGGHMAYIVPAGLIRSQGTETLRRYLIKDSNKLKYILLDNKARFFEIDSRFKFLIISHDKVNVKKKRCPEIILSICSTNGTQITYGNEIDFNVNDLEQFRPDLTIPECRTIQEKNLFFKICKNGRSWKDDWFANISREVDMTNNRSDFCSEKSEGDIPVIEGRMVQQFRFGAKAYKSGSGRSAKWIPTAGDELQPQFYMAKNKLSSQLQNRIEQCRVGYCDIAGQTNERAMMSAIIPPMVVCGNKVPTICFEGNNSDDYMYFWLGVTNSFVFDWLLRRVISTTVNYFLLFSMPMPDIDIESRLAKAIIEKSRKVSDMRADYYTGDRMEILRAEIDVLVSKAYGLDFSDLELLMMDFPLLDRAQTALNKEKRSSVTRDLMLSCAEKEYNKDEKTYTNRYKEEKKLKAKAYIPAEMADLCR